MIIFRELCMKIMVNLIQHLNLTQIRQLELIKAKVEVEIEAEVVQDQEEEEEIYTK